MTQSSPQLLELLNGMRQGDRAMADEVARMLYLELRTLAASHLRRERRGGSLQATELVGECFARLFQGEQPTWTGRAHFFGVAARLMRQILVDRARRRKAYKRPDDLLRVPLEDVFASHDTALWQVLAVDESLQRLEEVDPRLCRVVELRFFTGLDLEEIASILSLSNATVRRDLTFARAWLHREMTTGNERRQVSAGEIS